VERSLDSIQIEKLCAEYPYGQVPLVIDGRLVGMLDQKSLLDGHAPEQAVKQGETVYASATIREAVAKMVEKSASLLVVLSRDETPIGIVTLHDVVRLQSQVADDHVEGSNIATLSTFSKTFVNWSDPGARESRSNQILR
jgi:CBS domain containing-hemolysin-like protein